jgi:hypothetical protein
VEKEIARRNGTASGNSLGESLVAGNAKGVFHNVGYADTPINETQGAVESDPFRSLRKQVKRMERSIAQDMRADRLHKLLDEVLDEEEKKTTKRSTARDSQAARGGGCGRSFTCDRGALNAQAYETHRQSSRVY